MKLHKYNNYKEYCKNQIITNKRKLELVWVQEQELDSMVSFIKSKGRKKDLKGLCHGVRNGWEVEYFRKKLNAKVVGTDISDTASKFANVIEWDFHKIQLEWIGEFDFIYSNSLDHSYNPELALYQWMRCVNKKGVCFVHWAEAHSEAHMDNTDCFGASIDEYRKLIRKRYRIIKELNINTNKRSSIVLVVGHTPSSYRNLNQEFGGRKNNVWVDEKLTWLDKLWASDCMVRLHKMIVRGK